jgi:pimeloyl-ACP methyl ester carboxylesterase
MQDDGSPLGVGLRRWGSSKVSVLSWCCRGGWTRRAGALGRYRVAAGGCVFSVAQATVDVRTVSQPGIGMAPLADRLPSAAICSSTFRAGLSPPYLWQVDREQAVNVIAGVLDGLGIDRVTLVGNSLGGMFSLLGARPAVALLRPDRRPARSRSGSRATSSWACSPRLSGPGCDLDGRPRSASWVAGACGTGAPMRRVSDIIDLHLLSMRLPSQAASFRSLQKRLLVGARRTQNHLTDGTSQLHRAAAVRVGRERPVPSRPLPVSERRQDPLRFVTCPAATSPVRRPRPLLALVAEAMAVPSHGTAPNAPGGAARRVAAKVRGE